MEVGRAHFETENTRFTILDAPVSPRRYYVELYCNFFIWVLSGSYLDVFQGIENVQTGHLLFLFTVL